MKKSFSLLLAASLIISASACQSENTEISETTTEITSTATSTTPETTTSVTTAAVIEEEKRSYSLTDITIGEFREFRSNIVELGRVIPDIDISETMHYIEDAGTIRFTDRPAYSASESAIIFRESSRVLRESEDFLISAVNKTEYTTEIQTSYDIKWSEPELKFYASSSDGLKAISYTTEYMIRLGTDTITTRGFIKKLPDGTLHFIMDPAYTYGIPILSSLPKNMTYDINGRTIYADTLDFKIEKSAISDFLHETIDEILTEDYAYAEVELYNSINVRYTATDNEASGGYHNNCKLESINILTTNVDSVIDHGYMESDAEKYPEMEMVYRTVVDNTDVFYKETTNGMTFLDLDFDGTPELLVSDYVKYSDWEKGSDISVYRIENGELIYIDTIPNTITKPDTHSNDIGLKEFADGTKGWFITSYMNYRTGEIVEDIGCDYLYKLEGDKLIREELFTYGASQGEDTEPDYYIQGELMAITEDQRMVTFYDEPAMTTFYYWKDYSSFFSRYELAAFWLADYCEDITKSYNLCSDWLSDNKFMPVAVTERDLVYNIAYLADCFYLGEYEPSLRENYYWFMGAYAKPVIYLYPEEETEVSVSVDFADGGEITVSYPEYSNGWNVTAMPDGTIYDESGNEYYCLYWEGEGSAKLDLTKGWCVNGEDTAEFLREKLLYIGLTPREANEFIIYWLPIMQKNEYNIISIHTEEYKAAVPLTVLPQPDSEIRVFMTFTAADEYVEITPQQLPAYQRNGFTLVEWGGGEY